MFCRDMQERNVGRQSGVLETELPNYTLIVVFRWTARRWDRDKFPRFHLLYDYDRLYTMIDGT